MSQRPKCPECKREANILVSQKGDEYFQCPVKCLNPKPDKNGDRRPFWLGFVDPKLNNYSRNTKNGSLPSSVPPSSSSSSNYPPSTITSSDSTTNSTTVQQPNSELQTYLLASQKLHKKNLEEVKELRKTLEKIYDILNNNQFWAIPNKTTKKRRMPSPPSTPPLSPDPSDDEGENNNPLKDDEETQLPEDHLSSLAGLSGQKNKKSK